MHMNSRLMIEVLYSDVLFIIIKITNQDGHV